MFLEIFLKCSDVLKVQIILAKIEKKDIKIWRRLQLFLITIIYLTFSYI